VRAFVVITVVTKSIGEHKIVVDLQRAEPRPAIARSPCVANGSGFREKVDRILEVYNSGSARRLAGDAF
jgi:hypothetical protein